MEFRVGATGTGVFAGCGAGLGFITPISLHSIPVLGQLAGSLSSSLGSVDAALGGLGSAARRHMRGLGVKGLDAGFGCGVMVGYGYGVGLMLTPSAVQSLKVAAERLREQLLQHMPGELKARLERSPAVSPAGLQSTQQAAAPGLPLSSSWAPAPTGLPSTLPHGEQHMEGKSSSGAELADLMRLVHKQKNLLEDLQQQVQTLQAAVCRLDSSAPGCKSSM